MMVVFQSEIGYNLKIVFVRNCVMFEPSFTPEMAPSPLSSLRLGLWTTFSLAVLAIGSFGLSVLGEQRFEAGPEMDASRVEYLAEEGVEFSLDGSEWVALDHDQTLEAGMAFRTGTDNHVGILLQSADLIRLFPNTEIVFTEVDLEASPMVLKAELVSGSVWFSDLQGVGDFTFETSRFRVQLENASAHMSYDGDTVTVFAAHHPVRVSFLSVPAEDEVPFVLNHYLVTESHRVEVAESEISSKVAQLRYTKLTKEYPFVYVDPATWSSEWTSALQEDLDRMAQEYGRFVSFLRRNGEPGYEEGSVMYRLQGGWKSLRSLFVFDQDHLADLEEADGVSALYQALYLILENQDSAAIERLQRFQGLTLNFDEVETLEPLIQVFQGVNVDSDFYPVKELLRDLRVNAAPEDEQLALSLRFLRERLNEVYDLLDQGDLSDAKAALTQYNAQWQILIEKSGTQLVDAVQTLTEERQILQNLLYREPIFYDVEPYNVLTALEGRILNLTAKEYDLNEERQAFVQDRIEVLFQLISLVDDGRVGMEQGTDLGHQLIEESQELIRDLTTEVAIVSGFFVPTLNEMSLKLQFLNSPDYLLGEGTLDQKFEIYLSKEEDLNDLSEYILGLKEEESTTSITLDEALDQASADLEAAGVSYIALFPLGDVDYRLFEIEGGRIANTDFEANYDRDTQIVYDLRVQGDSFSTGVKLENLYEAVDQTSQSDVTDEIDSTSTTAAAIEEESLSPVESLAISLVRRSLEAETGLDLSEAQITIVDLEGNLFDVELILTRNTMETIVVTFRYAAEDNVLFDVVGEGEGQKFDVEDVEVATLDTSVFAAWDALQ